VEADVLVLREQPADTIAQQLVIFQEQHPDVPHDGVLLGGGACARRVPPDITASCPRAVAVDTSRWSGTRCPRMVLVLPAREGYDRWAEVYDDDGNPLLPLEEAQVARLLGDVRGQALADVGCGTGRHALRAASAGARVTAVDFSTRMLERARRKAGALPIAFVAADVMRPLPFPDAAFARILCCLVTEHIADLEALFRELGRIARGDAFVIVSAMHPAMMLKGVQARFFDPASGAETRPASYPHQIADYVMGATRAGLRLDHLSEHTVDAALAARYPRAEKYVGWPMLLVMRLTAR
jgi:SAM-dependent methyltransferase